MPKRSFTTNARRGNQAKHVTCLDLTSLMSFVGPASLSRFSRRLFGCSSTVHHTYRLSSPSLRRSYAWSRNPDTTRNRFGSATSVAKQAQRKQQRTAPDEPVWRTAEYERDTVSLPGGDSSAEDSLKQLLQNDTIVVVRYVSLFSILRFQRTT